MVLGGSNPTAPTHNFSWTLVFCFFRETEYKGLQLSLDQSTSKTSLVHSTSGGGIPTPRSRGSRSKPKTRLSPYIQVSASWWCHTKL